MLPGRLKKPIDIHQLLSLVLNFHCCDTCSNCRWRRLGCTSSWSRGAPDNLYNIYLCLFLNFFCAHPIKNHHIHQKFPHSNPLHFHQGIHYFGSSYSFKLSGVLLHLYQIFNQLYFYHLPEDFIHYHYLLVHINFHLLHKDNLLHHHLRENIMFLYHQVISNEYLLT